MPRDSDQIADLAAEVDALDSPSTADVLAHSQDYDAGIVAAEALRRSLTAGEGGGSVAGALTLLGPFSIDFDTAGFINPENNGISTLAIPAGTMVISVIPISTSEWEGSTGTDTMYVGLSTSTSGSGPLIGAFNLSQATSPTIGLDAAKTVDASITGGSVDAMSAGYQMTPAIAVADCHLIAGYFPAGAVSAGSVDLYAVIATPA